MVGRRDKAREEVLKAKRGLTLNLIFIVYGEYLSYPVVSEAFGSDLGRSCLLEP